jgi:heme-degrading monooxygenase HmoA
MQYQLAEINIATFRVPIADPVNADFIANLDRVNALAEGAPGFVWRLVGEGNNALDIQAFDNPNTAVNMSVWRDLDALASFVYRSEGHREIMRRRKEWFDRMEIHMALWWVAKGHCPTIAEGKERLETLSRVGPSAQAFLFNKPFPAPDAVSVSRLDQSVRVCGDR